MVGKTVVTRKSIFVTAPSRVGTLSKFEDIECIVTDMADKVIWRGTKIEFLKMWEIR